jgi:hypothetical protein
MGQEITLVSLPAPVRQCWCRHVAIRKDSVEADRELILEDARSISDGLWRMVRLAHNAAEMLDARIDGEGLDGLAEAVEVREALERLQTLSVEVSEEIDAYQNKHSA